MNERVKGLPPPGRGSGWMRLVYGVLGLLLLLVGFVTFGLPLLMGCRCGGNKELAAIGNLRTLITAQAIFRESDRDGDGRGNYGELAELAKAKLVDLGLAGGEKGQYRFTLKAGEGPSWWAAADPIIADDPHMRHFYVNQAGAIYVSAEGPIRPKTRSPGFEPDRGEALGGS